MKPEEFRKLMEEKPWYQDMLQRSREREQSLQEQRERMRKEHEEQEERRRRAAVIHRQLYDNPSLFLETEGLYQYDPDGTVSSRELYSIYRDWCIREELPLSTPRFFWLRMKEYAPKHAMTYCTVTDKDGNRCRGFRGIRPLPKDTDTTDVTDIQ